LTQKQACIEKVNLNFSQRLQYYIIDKPTKSIILDGGKDVCTGAEHIDGPTPSGGVLHFKRAFCPKAKKKLLANLFCLDTVMIIEEAQKEDIQQQIKSCGCTKQVKCIDTNFQELAPVRNIADSKLLECYTDKAKGCKFAMPFGGTHFCRCPVRAFLLKEFNI